MLRGTTDSMGDRLFSNVSLVAAEFPADRIQENRNEKSDDGVCGVVGSGGGCGERLLLDEEKILRHKAGRFDKSLLPRRHGHEEERYGYEEVRFVPVCARPRGKNFLCRPGSFFLTAAVRERLSGSSLNREIHS